MHTTIHATVRARIRGPSDYSLMLLTGILKHDNLLPATPSPCANLRGYLCAIVDAWLSAMGWFILYA